MKSVPDLLLVGHGVTDTLQITVEAQQLLQRFGKVYALNAPPNLRRYLAAMHIETVDLHGYFDRGRALADVYLDVADLLLGKTHEERPVILLTQDNPMLMNSLSRFLVAEARRRGQTALALPAVSQIDAVIAELGLDVGSFGLQVFDARRVVTANLPINPRVPLILLELAGYLANEAGELQPGDPARFAPLRDHLAKLYPGDHGITLLNTTSASGAAHATVTVARFDEFVPHISGGSCLYLDRVRSAQQ